MVGDLEDVRYGDGTLVTVRVLALDCSDPVGLPFVILFLCLSSLKMLTCGRNGGVHALTSQGLKLGTDRSA